jgi:hypothetical protein
LFTPEKFATVTVRDIVFSSPSQGRALCETAEDGSLLLTTTDGGATWTAETVPGYPGSIYWPLGRPYSMLAASGDRVWLGGDWDSRLVANFDPDQDPPATTLLTSYDGTWTNQDVTLAFDATDAVIGVAYTRSRESSGQPWGGVPWVYGDVLEVGAPADHANDGAHTVVFQSIDKLGQAETPQETVVKIDTLDPEAGEVVSQPAPVNGYVGPDPGFRWAGHDWSWAASVRPDNAVTCVDVVGDLAYLIDGQSIRILDVHNPYLPEELGALDLGVPLIDLAVVGGYAYLAAQEYGMFVVDVRDPTAPAFAGRRTLNGISQAIAVTNHTAYVRMGEGVAVVDVEKPTLPQQVNLIELRTVTDLAADGDALAVLSSNYLISFDVSDPLAPVERGTLAFPITGYPYGVDVRRDLACVALAYDGVEVVSVRAGSPPSSLAHFDLPGLHEVYVALDSTYATVAGADVVARVDLSDPRRPLAAGAFRTSDGRYVGGVEAANGYVYAPRTMLGMEIWRSMPTEAASYEIDASPSTVPDETPDGGVSETTVAGVGEGTRYFHVRMRDQAGNWSAASHLALNVDATAPAVTTNADATWRRSFTLDLSASDALSGLASTQLSVDGGPFQTATSVTLRTWKRGGGSGPRTVAWRAIDNVGNLGTGTATVLIDGRPPVTTDDAPTNPLDRGNPPPQTAPVTVTLTATDAHSGVGRTWYSLDGGDWTEGTSVLVPADPSGEDDGLHWIGYFSQDRARNVESSHWVAVVIDVPTPQPSRTMLRGPRR